MRVESATRILLLATAALSVGWAQPTITSLQSSVTGSEVQPQDVTGVTSATASLSGGFILYINGTFDPASFLNVKWLNTSTNVTTTFSSNIQVGTTQISLTIPFALFSTAVVNPVLVTVTVTETGGSSSATYTINPPLRAIGPILPSGTLNRSYTTSVIFGGTPPFDPGIPTTGTLPPGLTPQLDATLTGTPAQTGVFNFQDSITDFWGNSVKGDDTIEIVDVPTVTSLVPNSSGSGAGNLTIAVNGTNFVNSVAVGAAAIPGSKVSWVGQVVTPLATTFVNANQLTAVVPSALLATPGFAAVTVVQPSNVSSTVGPSSAFSILPPSISSISPPSAPVGSNSTTITVHGANFVVGAASSVSTVSLNNTPLATTFVDTGTLTALIPSTMLTAPGLYIVRVTNPGGAVSSPATFSVLAAVLNSISPNALPVGSGDFTLVASGASFVSGSQILFNGTALTTTFINGTFLSATVPGTLITRAGQFDVRVRNPGGSSTPAQIFSVLSPAITSISPTSIAAGAATFTLTVNGNNFASGAQVSFDGTPLTTINGDGPLLATVPASLVAGPKVASIVVTNPGLSGNVSGSASFTVIGSLSIVTTSIPSGTAGTAYSATFTGRGGTPPYSWSASGIPGGFTLNPTTGVLSGVNQSGGTFTLSVVLQDAAKATATAQFQLVLAPPLPPPVSISPSSTLPSGIVGVAYQGFVFASGGADPYTFSLGSGNLPDGLTLLSTGGVFGTPKTPGQFSFTVVVTDSKGGTASKGFSITIQPAPLGITGGPPTSSVPPGSPITITFTGTGGVPPYRYTACSAPPPGTSFSNGVFSGTLTTAGTFTTCVTVADTAGAVATKSASLVVAEAPPGPLSLGGTVGDGKVGVPYSGQLSASGGTGPYTFAGSGLPDGLTLSTSGAISGTPGTAGQFSLSATVTDSKGGTASGTFPITIARATLSIVTASLPDGAVGVAYSATLTAAGGFPPYTWSISGLPDGVSSTPNGVISGTPKTAGKFAVGVVVKDGAPGSSAPSKSYTITISPAALVITTATAPNGTVGTPYTASFAASGGTTPLTFSATGLPDGLTMSTAGTISGTPTAPVAATIVVTVKDAGGATTSKNYSVTIALPPAPPLTISGVPATSPPLQQPRLQVSLGNTFPLDVVVTLTLTFAPDSGPDDPTVQFSSGGRIARITVPAGSLNGSTDVGVQTGSVAGLITIVSQMQSGGQDVTPSPAPRTTIRIAPAAPVIVTGSLTAVRNSTGFTVTLTGYVTDREMTQAIFQFTAAAGGNLQTTTLTVPIDTIFATYFSGASAVATGSQFTYTQPFTVTGSTQAIVSVTVTLVNKIGQSAPATATLN